MTQTTGRFFDEIAKMMTDAAGAAHGVSKEVKTALRAQAERALNELDMVQRDEFEAVKAMAQKAREENARLEAQIAELEAKLEDQDAGHRPDLTPRPIRHDKPKPSF